jgi:hypothetical protein
MHAFAPRCQPRRRPPSTRSPSTTAARQLRGAGRRPALDRRRLAARSLRCRSGPHTEHHRALPGVHNDSRPPSLAAGRRAPRSAPSAIPDGVVAAHAGPPQQPKPMVLGERASRPVRASRRDRKSRIHTWRSPFGDLARTTRTCREDHVDDTGHGSCDTANRAPTHRGCNRVQLISGVAGAADEDDDRCDGCALAVAAGLSAASGARCSQTRPRSCCRRVPNPAVGRGGSPTERSEGGSNNRDPNPTGSEHEHRPGRVPGFGPGAAGRTTCSTASQSVTSALAVSR